MGCPSVPGERVYWRGRGGYTGAGPLGPPPQGTPAPTGQTPGARVDQQAFVCDRCTRPVMGRPAAYWTTAPFFEQSTDCSTVSQEFCRACTDEIQQAVGRAPRLPRADRRSLLGRLAGH